MGTNYYLEREPCPHCGSTGDSRQHIGKSSAGWCFSLHVDPDAGIHDLADWQGRWAADGLRIVDEYGLVVSPAVMQEVITERIWKEKDYDSQFLRQNEAQVGPHNLLRHRLNDRCIKHGNGTWDCIVGEFS